MRISDWSSDVCSSDLRGAVAKVISRPSFNDLGSRRSLTYRSAAYAFDRGQFGEFEGWSGSGGNADLAPFEAWPYDLGVEIGRAHVELQSLMRISYAVFCLNKKKHTHSHTLAQYPT